MSYGARKVPVSRFSDNLYDWQRQTLEAFGPNRVPNKRFFMAECHRRSRKTALILNLLIREAIRNPKSVYPYVGPTYRQAKSIAWRDPNMLFSFLPDPNVIGWTKNESELYIKFYNGSILPIKGADEPDTLRGLDAEGVGFDEWSLMKKEVWTDIFYPIIRQKPSRWAIFGYTPNGLNHATRMFDYAACLDLGGVLPTNGPAVKMRDEYFAIRILADRSNIIPPIELKKAKAELPRTIFEQEYLCARVTDEEKTLITSAMLERLKRRDWNYQLIPIVKKIISVDPAFGGNECVAKAMSNIGLIDQDIMHDRDTGKVVGRILDLSYLNVIKSFIVDCIGNGKGVADGLAAKSDDERTLNVIYFNSAEKSDSERFYNKRAEAWWYVMQKVNDMEIPYPEDAETVRQIPFASRYTFNRNGKLIMLPKEKIIELCGCSPDRAETWMMGHWGMQFIEPESEPKTRYRDSRREYDKVSAMCC